MKNNNSKIKFSDLITSCHGTIIQDFIGKFLEKYTIVEVAYFMKYEIDNFTKNHILLYLSENDKERLKNEINKINDNNKEIKEWIGKYLDEAIQKSYQ